MNLISRNQNSLNNNSNASNLVNSNLGNNTNDIKPQPFNSHVETKYNDGLNSNSTLGGFNHVPPQQVPKTNQSSTPNAVQGQQPQNIPPANNQINENTQKLQNNINNLELMKKKFMDY